MWKRKTTDALNYKSFIQMCIHLDTLCGLFVISEYIKRVFKISIFRLCNVKIFKIPKFLFKKSQLFKVRKSSLELKLSSLLSGKLLLTISNLQISWFYILNIILFSTVSILPNQNSFSPIEIIIYIFSYLKLSQTESTFST